MCWENFIWNCIKEREKNVRCWEELYDLYLLIWLAIIIIINIYITNSRSFTVRSSILLLIVNCFKNYFCIKGSYRVNYGFENWRCCSLFHSIYSQVSNHGLFQFLSLRKIKIVVISLYPRETLSTLVSVFHCVNSKTHFPRQGGAKKDSLNFLFFSFFSYTRDHSFITDFVY